jgi:hypothetical protein
LQDALADDRVIGTENNRNAHDADLRDVAVEQALGFLFLLVV